MELSYVQALTNVLSQPASAAGGRSCSPLSLPVPAVLSYDLVCAVLPLSCEQKALIIAFFCHFT